MCECANPSARTFAHYPVEGAPLTAPLPSTGSLKALAQARLGQTCTAHNTRTLPRTLPEDSAHITPEKDPLMCGDESALMDRCRTACKGLSLWPAELMAAMTDEDQAAQLSGEEGPEVLRAFAESLAARLRTGTLPANLHEAYARLRAELAANPSLRFACETLTPDADPVLLAVAVRGAGFATLRIAKDRYDEGQLLEIIDRVGRPSPCAG